MSSLAPSSDRLDAKMSRRMPIAWYRKCGESRSEILGLVKNNFDQLTLFINQLQSDKITQRIGFVKFFLIVLEVHENELKWKNLSLIILVQLNISVKNIWGPFQ